MTTGITAEAPERSEDRREVLRRIGLADRSPDGAPVADDRIGDHSLRIMEDGEQPAGLGSFEHVAVARHSADQELVAVAPEVGELSQIVDVDEDLGPGQAQLHHREKAVTPCRRGGFRTRGARAMSRHPPPDVARSYSDWSWYLHRDPFPRCPG